MGEDKLLACYDCEAYTEIDKLPLHGWQSMAPEEWFKNRYRQMIAQRMMSFLADHMEHEVRLLGEYGEWQSEFFRIAVSDEWEEEYVNTHRMIKE